MIKIDKILASANIADELDEKELQTIFKDCDEGYNEDLNSREEWSSRQDDYMKLALQVVENKNTPWANAANVKYPLLTTATMQFGARAYPGLIPGPQIIKGRVSGFDPTGQKTKSAERIGKHMSYQLIEEMDDWEEEMDKLCVSIPVTGCMFKKTYFSSVKQKNVSELVYPKHLVVNYWTKTLREAPRITHEIYLSDNEIYERIQSGVFTDQDYIKEYVEGDDVKDQVHGVQAPSNSETTPHLFKEQHTWLDLDDDGYKEPYIVTFGDSKVARIVACFDEDGITKNGDKVVSIERIEYFTKYGFVPSPDGSFYDIGFGLLLGPINDSINTTLNQLHDAGTMATRAGGFLGRGAKIRGGKHSFKPFEWQNLQSTGDDIRKNIFPLPVREPSPVLFNLLGLLIEAGKELSSTVPMMMGQNPGQNQPATTSMAVIEQGLKVYSAIFKRMHRALKEEAKKLKRLNRLYLPLESYFSVLDPRVGEDGEKKVAEMIWREDYKDDQTDVQLYSDPNIVAEVQRMIKAQQVSEMMQQGLIPNQQAGVKIVLEAMDLPNVDELLTPPEPQPDPEMELKMAEFQHKQEKDMRDLGLAEERLILDQTIAEDKSELDQTVQLLNIAKAEAAEQGTTISAYEAQLKELKIHAESEKRQAREDEALSKKLEAMNKKKEVKLKRDANGDLEGGSIG